METTDCGLLVIGAGHAGSELAMAARQGGWLGAVTLLGEEQAVPYHRPPLSKAYMCGESDAESIALRPAAAYEAAHVTRRMGARLVAIDRAAHEVELGDGSRLHYRKLALCTGGRPRTLSCEGIDPAAPPANLLYLRNLADADAIRGFLRPGAEMVVVGGGYLGLEVAASASKHGTKVTVLEAQPRVLARVAGAELSAFYESVHRAHGVEIMTGVAVSRAECDGGNIVAMHLTDGRRLRADVVVAGIGMIPNIDAAIDAGLAAGSEGIPVDENSCTVDPDILAAGDCTLQVHPLYGRQLRLESVPNALEQARAAAGWLCGKPKPNRSVPWFWSDQYDLKLQMAGLSQGHDRCVIRGDTASHSFSAFYFQGGKLLAVDAVNRPAEFMQVKRSLTAPVLLDPERIADESVSLKDLLAAGAPTP